MSTPTLSPGLLQLLSLVRVVDAGSFAEAARRAGTTTSAMSKAIGRFERQHGVRLLHRTTHSIALTEEGDRLLGAGRALLENVERVEAAIAEVEAGVGGGRVRVTAPTSFARACIAPALPAFLRAHPDIRIEIQFRNEIVDLAAEGVDLAIRTGNIDRLPGHQARKMFNFRWIACAAPAYLDVRGAPETPADLADHDHIGFRNPATGQLLTWRFADPKDRRMVRFTPKPKHVFDDAVSVATLARAGLGLVWGPIWILFEDLRAGRLREVLAPWRVPDEPLWLLRTSSRHAPQRTLRTMEFLSSLSSAWADLPAA